MKPSCILVDPRGDAGGGTWVPPSAAWPLWPSCIMVGPGVVAGTGWLIVVGPGAAAVAGLLMMGGPGAGAAVAAAAAAAGRPGGEKPASAMYDVPALDRNAPGPASAPGRAAARASTPIPAALLLASRPLLFWMSATATPAPAPLLLLRSRPRRLIGFGADTCGLPALLPFTACRPVAG